MLMPPHKKPLNIWKSFIKEECECDCPRAYDAFIVLWSRHLTRDHCIWGSLVLGHTTGMLSRVPRYTVPNAPEPQCRPHIATARDAKHCHVTCCILTQETRVYYEINDVSLPPRCSPKHCHVTCYLLTQETRVDDETNDVCLPPRCSPRTPAAPPPPAARGRPARTRLPFSPQLGKSCFRRV